MRFFLFVVLCSGLAACVAPATNPPKAPATQVAPEIRTRAEAAARRFISVANTIEPVAEDLCRQATEGVPCDFLIVVDDRIGLPPNAYQTVDALGRPVVAFSLALIARSQNTDELAFVMGHEAAHHIAGHIDRQKRNARAGAQALGQMARQAGASAKEVRAAQSLGAVVGARSYSQEHELEADVIGARIALAAGYDPLRGAAFFRRVPDPGDQFLGTHPPNAARLEAVRRVVQANGR